MSGITATNFAGSKIEQPFSGWPDKFDWIEFEQLKADP